MKTKIITFLILFIGVSHSWGSQPMQVKDNSQPGLWQVELEIKENDSPLVKRKVQKCLSKEYLEKNSTYDLEKIWDKNKLSCTIDKIKIKDKGASFDAICQSLGDKKHLTIEADYISEKEHSLITSEYTTEINNKKRKISSSIKGTRLGECK